MSTWTLNVVNANVWYEIWNFIYFCSAWLDETDDILVDKMSKRIEAYSGLSMESAEKLQVFVTPWWNII